MSSDTDATAPSARTRPDQPDAPRAAAQLLEMAARDAELWRSEARSEAAAVVDGARTEAARLVQAGREEADRLTGEARAEVETLRTELAELRQLERDHREHVRAHLTGLLEQVDAPRSDEA